MGGRLALVIGSECEAFPKLGFVHECASDLYKTLTDLGSWEPACGQTGPLISPCTDTMVSAVSGAFAEASTRQATLLLAFIGHGQADGVEDYFLFAKDSTCPPTSHTAFHFPQEIRENLKKSINLDGLIVLADACESAEGVRGIGKRCLELLVAAGGRMELMTASTDTPAYNGCFTRTLVGTARRGHRQAGEYLLCADLKPSLIAGCPAQTPLLLSFDGVTIVPDGTADRGLYLVPNVARRGGALAGTAAADLVDQFTRGVVITDTVRESYERLREADAQRLRAVIGPAGAGKSTLVSLLLRPELVADDETRIAVHAGVFLDSSASLDTFAATLADQLSRSVTGFTEAAAAVRSETDVEEFNSLDAVEARVSRPLVRCRVPGQRVRVLIDGLDQPEEQSCERVMAAIAALGDPHRRDLDHLRLIVTARPSLQVTQRPGLAHAHVLELPSPSADDLSRVIQHRREGRLLAIKADLLARLPSDGGWLIARLLSEVEDRFMTSADVTLEELAAARWRQAVHGLAEPTPMTTLISVLTAVGAGAVLPIGVLSQAMQRLGHPVTVPVLRDLLVRLGALTARSGFGTDDERDGLAHPALSAILDVGPGSRATMVEGLDTHAAHAALAWVLSEYLSEGHPASATGAYLAIAGPRHHARIHDAQGIIAVLASLDGPSAAENRDRWAAWMPTIQKMSQRRSPENLAGLARFALWQGMAGDSHSAVASLREILAQRLDVLGPYHPDTLGTRQLLAYWLGEIRNFRGAVQELEELHAAYKATLGAEHQVTLATERSLAYWRSTAGDPAGARQALESELEDRRRALGPDHGDTLAARHALAYWRGEAGDAAGAVAALKDILADRVRILGPDDPQTLTTRHDLAYWRGVAGDPAGAVTALRDLLADRLRVLGPDDPACLTTRHNIATWQARAGDVEGAVGLLDEVLVDRRRILGPSHPHTLETRHELAYWRGGAGDAVGAAVALRELLQDRLGVLGPDHPDTLTTRHNLGSWQGRAGNPGTAVGVLSDVLEDRLRILGPDHPHTLLTRYELAYWRGMAGQIKDAVTELQVLLADSKRNLGPDHPQTRATQVSLDYWHRAAGDKDSSD